ncbi:MATE family efflux transporter [Tahibacter amnicola]|uniref:Multidrug-efflux transporter n=1 Tax=Tahibacter amnicola TaxID=2976241 RepID=A0ABY6BG01_9GAMM|nr:MATE family efflux transporter [Tahibacter amnicola]UXI68958.1 MATE family efflux transporter [Tahibacter amnicola]
MKDLTQGSIRRHILEMAAPLAAGMMVQMLYFLVDLYFVARLGDAALAGVSTAGNIMFLILGLTTMLGAGTVALIAHAVGRKDPADANLIFNQSLVLAVICALVTLAVGYGFGGRYMHSVGADAATTARGIEYLLWYTPGLAMQFALVAMSSALRGTGIVKPAMVVQMLTVVLNIILAPVLIAGWGTGYAMGVAGAGLASSLAIAVGVIMLAVYFVKLEKYVHFSWALARPHLGTWKRLLLIGLPAGGEFALVFVYMGVIYWIIKQFGAAAQAGFGIGTRVMQAIFLPAMAIAFAVAPIAGQNFGARQIARVHETFRSAALLGAVVMLTLTLLAQWRPQWLISAFTTEADVTAVGVDFLRIISWNFVASGFVFTCSSLFQGLGNTLPSLLSTGTRLISFVLPAIWLSTQPGFRLEHVWYLSVATVALQAVVSYFMARDQLRRRAPLPA